MLEKNHKQFRTAAVKQLLLVYFMLIIQMVIFFVSAGQTVMLRPALFFGASFLHLTVSTAVLYKFNPQLLIQRLKRKREGSRLWDEILMRTCNLIVLLVVPAVAGLNVERFQLSGPNVLSIIVGFHLFIVSAVLLDWAMVTNPFFESTVRIQKDRGHKVVKGGPYKVIRHPGYLAGILFALSIPLIIGSPLTFVPAGIYTLLMIVRTRLEDRTLSEELDEYSEYTKRVRYRLFPGIW